MSDTHYGYLKNSFCCSCGKHFGPGDRTPEQRAASLARMRDTIPHLMDENMRDYLADFERYHGTVHYTMGEIGANSGHFVKANKGQTIIGPIYDTEYDMAKAA